MYLFFHTIQQAARTVQYNSTTGVCYYTRAEVADHTSRYIFIYQITYVYISSMIQQAARTIQWGVCHYTRAQTVHTTWYIYIHLYLYFQFDTTGHIKEQKQLLPLNTYIYKYFFFFQRDTTDYKNGTMKHLPPYRNRSSSLHC